MKAVWHKHYPALINISIANLEKDKCEISRILLPRIQTKGNIKFVALVSTLYLFISVKRFVYYARVMSW